MQATQGGFHTAMPEWCPRYARVWVLKVVEMGFIGSGSHDPRKPISGYLRPAPANLHSLVFIDGKTAVTLGSLPTADALEQMAGSACEEAV